MAGLDTQRLVLIHSTIERNGIETDLYGTGYFVTNELVLTAQHVLIGDDVEPARLRGLEVRVHEGDSGWRTAQFAPVWEDQLLDAALICVEPPIASASAVDWGDTNFEDNVGWDTTAYPFMSREKTAEGTQFKSLGLSGTIYAHGGQGQGMRYLDLTVVAPPKEGGWYGISGSPVFANGKLVGVIRSYPEAFQGERLEAIPIDQLLQDPRFRVAIQPEWLVAPRQKMWVLVLRSENENSDLVGSVRAAIKTRIEDIERATGQTVAEEPIQVQVSDVLEKPERWLRFAETMCKVPVMVADVTGLQPAVMTLLGIRSVVRRGVTIVAGSLTKDEMSNLPFNIKETKLLHLSDLYGIRDLKYPPTSIGNAIVDGLRQLKSHPSYLDLPAYDAVRCPKPSGTPKGNAETDKSPSALNTALMLCSFNDRYEGNYDGISTIIGKKVAPQTLVRMLDISSPRLVGQALYEHIRWSPCCIVDWTDWRANVFFELGVRLACSEIGPICLIEKKKEKLEAEASVNGSELLQHEKLVKLLRPIEYVLGGNDKTPFDQAFDRHKANTERQKVSIDGSMLAHDDTYQIIVDSYDWSQEPITRSPHEELRANVAAQVGEDQQQAGLPQILFSSNPQFARAVQHSIQERWIAQWCYLRDRYQNEPKSQGELGPQLIALGNKVLNALGKKPSSPYHKRLRVEIAALLKELGKR